MRIEDSAGIGLLLDGGPHSVKNVYFDSGNLYDRDNGDDPIEGNNAVVVGATGVNNLIDNVVVKQFGGNAFVVDGAGTIIQNSSVDGIGLDGFVVTGTGSTLKGNDVQHARRGFVVAATGVDTDLNTNTTEEVDGDGFVVDGDTAVLTSNSAAVSVQGNGGRGFVIGGGSGLIETNTAEKNDGDGLIVTGNGHTFKGNKSKENGLTGFTISGTGNQINTDAAEQNGGLEWVVGPDNFDGGSNKMKPFSADSRLLSHPLEDSRLTEFHTPSDQSREAPNHEAIVDAPRHRRSVVVVLPPCPRRVRGWMYRSGWTGCRKRVPDLRECGKQERDVRPGPIAPHPRRGKDHRAPRCQWEHPDHRRLCRPGSVPVRDGPGHRDHG